MAATFTNFAGAQWSGNATFVGGVQADSVTSATASPMTFTTSEPEGGGNNGFIINTPAYTNANIVSFRNNGAEKLNVASSGFITFAAGGGIQLSGGNLYGAGLVAGLNVTVRGDAADGSTAVGVAITTANAFANATAKLVSVQNNGTEKLAFDLNGKEIIPTGGAAAVTGQATMTSGAVTVSTTAVTASSIIFLTHAGTGITTNFGHLYVGTITAGTSFQIKSTGASDNDKVNWRIVN